MDQSINTFDPPLLVDSYKSIVEFIDAQFESYLQEELKIKRTLHSYHDTRIHACLYFIAPTGHSLKSLDLVTMKKLDSKVGPSQLLATTMCRLSADKIAALVSLSSNPWPKSLQDVLAGHRNLMVSKPMHLT